MPKLSGKDYLSQMTVCLYCKPVHITTAWSAARLCHHRRVDLEQLREVGNTQHPAHIAAAVDDADIRRVATGMIAQQQQHAERRAVEVFGVAQVHDIAARRTGPFISLAKILMGTDSKAASDADGQLLAIV